MNAPYIISQAIQLVAQGAKHPTISKLVGFLGTDEGETLMALRAAPDHVQRAFGLTASDERTLSSTEAFKLNTPKASSNNFAFRFKR